jgi:hypothetical protein
MENYISYIMTFYNERRIRVSRVSNCCFTTPSRKVDIILHSRKADIILPSRKADIILPGRKATITHSGNSYSSLVIECHNIADIIQ